MNKGYYINGVCFNKEQYDLYMDLLIESHNIRLENKQLQAAIRENIVLTGVIYNIKEELKKTEIYKDKEVKENE